MNHEALFPIKVLALIAFAGMLVLAVWMLKNDHRLFGYDPEVPSDNASPRNYGKAQVWLIWLLMLKVFAFFGFAI